MKMLKTLLILLSSMFASLIRAQSLDADPEYTALVNEAVSRVAEAKAEVKVAETNLYANLSELKRRYRAAEAGRDSNALRAVREQLLRAQQDKLRTHRDLLSDYLAKVSEAVRVVAAATGALKATTPAAEAEALRRVQALDNVQIALATLPASSSDASDAMDLIAKMASEDREETTTSIGRLLLIQKRILFRIARIDRALRRGDAASLKALLNDLEQTEGGDILADYNAFCSEIAGDNVPHRNNVVRRKLRTLSRSDDSDDISKPF